jgi:molybdenum cofactor biosynthesis protein B
MTTPHPISPLKANCAILTLSDTRTPDTDASGKRIIELLAAAGHTIGDYQILPDEPARIEPIFLALRDRAGIDVILTNGGTGISRRDQTVEVIEKELRPLLPGFGELFRMLSYEQVQSNAMLSRAVAGLANGKPTFCLPGSTAAVTLAMTKLILPQLSHLLSELRK